MMITRRATVKPSTKMLFHELLEWRKGYFYMKRFAYLLLIFMLLGLGSTASANDRGCQSNGHGSSRSAQARGCDSNAPAASNTTSSGQGASSSNAPSNSQGSGGHPPAGAGCRGLENAYAHHSENSPALATLIRNMKAHGCDKDGDGVINVLDQCPDTPAGVEVDEAGCPLGQPDLIIEIPPDLPATDCISGCVMTVQFTVTNIGDGNVTTNFDVSGQATQMGAASTTISGGLAAGASVSGSLTFGPTPASCFQPDCSVTLTVDSGDVVPESDETNNTASGFWLG
jgi:CARDB protein